MDRRSPPPCSVLRTTQGCTKTRNKWWSLVSLLGFPGKQQAGFPTLPKGTRPKGTPESQRSGAGRTAELDGTRPKATAVTVCEPEVLSPTVMQYPMTILTDPADPGHSGGRGKLFWKVLFTRCRAFRG
jgi:hypothetical protein